MTPVPWALAGEPAGDVGTSMLVNLIDDDCDFHDIADIRDIAGVYDPDDTHDIGDDSEVRCSNIDDVDADRLVILTILMMFMMSMLTELMIDDRW